MLLCAELCAANSATERRKCGRYRAAMKGRGNCKEGCASATSGIGVNYRRVNFWGPIWMSAAFHSAIRADRDSTIGAVSNRRLAAADRIAVSVIELNLAVRASHIPTLHRLDRIRASLELVRCRVHARIIHAFRSSANIADFGSCTTC